MFVSLLLNDQPRGEFFVLMSDGGDFLISKEDLQVNGIDLKGSVIVVEGSSYVSLLSLKPDIVFEFNEKTLTLLITADPAILGTATFDFSARVPSDIDFPQNDSAFINYSVNYFADDGFTFREFNVPFETSVRYKDYVVFSNFSFSYKDGGDEEFARLLTNVTRDDRVSLVRYTAGDLTASSGELGGGALVAGFSITKNYSLNQHFVRYPGINLEGLIYSPSDVEIWRDGSLLKRERVEPGKFEFLNIPATTGAGEAIVVIRDSYGDEKRIIVPFYFSSALLKKGLHEFTYNAGVVRENFGEDDWNYDAPVFIASHKYGISDKLTGGFRAEIGEDLSSGGLTASFAVPGAGFLDSAVAASINHSNGFAYSLGYSDNSKEAGLWWRVTMRGHTRKYSNLTLLPDRDRARTELVGSVGFASTRAGSVSLFYTSSDNYLSDDVKRLTARYSKAVTRDLSFDISASNTESDDTENEVFATIRYLFGNSTTGNLSVRTAKNENSGSLTVQRTPPSRTGIGYRVVAEQSSVNDDFSHSNDAELTYYGSKAVLTGKYRESNKDESHTLRASGSLGYVNGALHLGQPINDSFAVVKVGSLPGVEVLHSNRSAGRTDRRGEIMIPYLISNYDNKISLNEKDIPINYSLSTSDQFVSPMFRSGTMLKFEVAKIQSVFGSIHVVDKGQREPAEFWHLVLKKGDLKIESPVGRDGEFYLENVPAGMYEATIYNGEQQCEFGFEIPESDEMFIDVEELDCLVSH